MPMMPGTTYTGNTSGGAAYVNEMAQRQAAIKAAEDKARAAGQQGWGAGAVQQAQQQQTLSPQGVGNDAQEIYRQALANAQRGYQAGDLSGGVGLARSAALGEAPSAANAQLRSGLTQVNQQAMGLAAGARGAERGALRLQAQAGAAERGAALAPQAAALRANEMATGRQQYMQALEAQEQANRGAFQTTAGAQQGFLGVANQGLGTRLDAAQLSYQDALARDKMAQEDRIRREAAASNGRNALIRGALVGGGALLGTTLLPGIGTVGGAQLGGALAGGAMPQQQPKKE